MVFVVVMMALGGCWTSTAVARRASFDLACEAGMVQIVELGGYDYAAKGCGSRAVYHLDWRTDAVSLDGPVILNNEPVSEQVVTKSKKHPSRLDGMTVADGVH